MATLTSSFSKAGTYSLTAYYEGDTTYSTRHVERRFAHRHIEPCLHNHHAHCVQRRAHHRNERHAYSRRFGPPQQPARLRFTTAAPRWELETLSSGKATLATMFAAGTHSVTATYGGDSTYASSTSSAVLHQLHRGFVERAIYDHYRRCLQHQTHCRRKRDPHRYAFRRGRYGKSRFYDASTSPVSLLGTATLDSGTATLPVTFTTSGTHQIMARYNGSSGYAVSTTEDALPIIIDK